MNTCPTCGHMCAPNAGNCMNCGHRFWPIVKGAIQLLLAIIIGLVIVGIVGAVILHS